MNWRRALGCLLVLVLLAIIAVPLVIASLRRNETATESSPSSVTDLPPEISGEAGASTQTDAEPTPGTTLQTQSLPPVEQYMLGEPQLISVGTGVASTLPAGVTVMHPVTRGEWLIQIARCYATPYQNVHNANPLPNPNLIFPGNWITVPAIGSLGPITGPPCVWLYTVRSGDTWEQIAVWFQTTTTILQKANPGPLYVGRQIWVPAIPTPTTTPPPIINHNLLFIYNDDLATWHGPSGTLEVLPDPLGVLVDITSNSVGEWVLARQFRANSNAVEIALINRRTRVVMVLEQGLVSALPTADGVENMVISADGQWGAYLVRENNNLRLTTFPTINPTARLSVSLLGHGQNATIAPQLFPGQDNAHFLLLSEVGVFEFEYALPTTARPLVFLAGGSGGGPISLHAVAWSPASRYLLLKGNFLGGNAYYVLDRQTGALQQLPNSTSYATVATASWRMDGSIVVLTPPTSTTATGPMASFYQPQSSGVTLTLVHLFDRQLSVPGATAGIAGSGYSIMAPGIQSLPGRITFTISGADTAVNGLWGVDGDSSTMTRLNGLPSNSIATAEWTPDSSGLLLTTPGTTQSASNILYVAADGSQPFSLTGWLGFRIADFHWMNP
jgi:hypothetical protein